MDAKENTKNIDELTIVSTTDGGTGENYFPYTAFRFGINEGKDFPQKEKGNRGDRKCGNIRYAPAPPASH